MGLCHQPTQVQAQPYAARASLARCIGAKKWLGQVRQVQLIHTRAVVAHTQQQIIALAGKADRDGCTGSGADTNTHTQTRTRLNAVAPRVVQQVAHEQAQAHAVDLQLWQARSQVQQYGRCCGINHVLHEPTQISRFAIEGSMAIRQPLAFQQVGDQAAHFCQVAQQGVARHVRVCRLRQQLGVQARARQR